MPSYNVLKSDGTTLATVADGIINSTASSIKFIGRTIVDYGQDIAENQVHIMENFANTTSPLVPIAGQLWWDTNVNILKVYDGATFGQTALQNIVEDTTPQLGGNLDNNGFKITTDGSVVLSFASSGENAENWVDIVHAQTGFGPIIRSVGSDTNVDLNISAKGAGIVNLGSGGVKLNAPLDVNNQAFTNVGSFSFGNGVVLSFASGGESGVNWVDIVWAESGSGPVIRSVGSDTNVDLNLTSKGTGVVNITGAVTVSSTVDGRDIAADGALLDTALQDVADDLNPQLGGNLDNNGFAITTDSNVVLSFTSDSEFAVNWVDVVHAPTGFGPIVRSVGADTNVDLVLDTKGTGDIDVSTNKIVNVVDPTADQGAATKKYVDDNIGFDLGEFTVAGLPTASLNANGWALATNASGGRTIVRSDGTDWKVVAVEGATVTT